MKIAVTGATGFVGRELVRQLTAEGQQVRCWYRKSSNRAQFDLFTESKIEWVPGQLANPESSQDLMAGCQAVIHAGIWRPGKSFQSNEMDVVEYAQTNILGTLELIEAARRANVDRFVFVSTCAVHDHILEDRPLDEAHPLWANSHYGAHKAAIEQFIHSYGLGEGFPICGIRPTGIYGPTNPISNSKWYRIIQAVALGEPVEVKRGGKEVHVADVAKAIRLLLKAENIAGQIYSCYDQYISEYDVAQMTKHLTGSESPILGDQKRPKFEIDNSKIKTLGMEFSGDRHLRETITQILDAR